MILCVKAGDSGRGDLSQKFIENDLAAIGPGKGKFDPANHPERYLGNEKTFVQAMHDAQTGQNVVLLFGSEVRAIGKVDDDAYQYEEGMPLFGNWDLFHVVRVKWARPNDSAVAVLRRDAPKAKGRLPRVGHLKWGNHEVSD